jgi:hypothetical protein
VTESDRSERLLTLLVLQGMKGLSLKDKSVELSRAGFAHQEIADLLGITAQSVRQNVYVSKQTSAPKTKRKKRAVR